MGEEDGGKERKLRMDDLPNEILLRILSQLDNTAQTSALLVSKRWHELIDGLIGRKLFVGRQCQLVPQDQQRYLHKYVEVSAISKIGVTECFVGEVEEPALRMTLWTYVLSKIKKALFSDEDAAAFKYPFLLRAIHFDGPIPSVVFQSMTRNISNVTKVEMHTSAFCCLNSADVVNFGGLWRRLEELTVWGHRLTDGIFTSFYDNSNVLKNVITLLSNDFKELTEFAVEYPYDIRDDREYTQAILKFMERHRKLQKFKICVNIATSEEPSEFDSMNDREWIRDAKKASKQLRLKELEIVVSSMRKVRLTKLWIAFIEQQKTLESAIILSFRIPATLLAAVCESNRSAMKELFISRILMTNQGRPVQLNCSIFTPCTNLTRLTVEGMLHSHHDPGMILTRLLPKSLTHVEIGGFLLNHQDVQDVFFGLPKVQHVCFTDVGNAGQFGVTVDTIRQVIAERTIQTVTLYRSVCGLYPPSGIPNGNPNENIVIRLRPYEILEFRLNDTGYYENLRRHSIFDEFTQD